MDRPDAPSLDLLQRAVDQLSGLISPLNPAHAGLPTPCSEFDLRAVLNHIVYDMQVFTAMISGGQRGSPDIDLLNGIQRVLPRSGNGIGDEADPGRGCRSLEEHSEVAVERGRAR